MLAQYNSATNRANTTSLLPFQDYSGQFVAPVNQTQQQGIAATTAAANEAQPYYGAGEYVLDAAQNNTGALNNAAEYATAASAAPVSGADINNYLSPYLGDVLTSTEALQNQSNQQAQAGQLGNAITSGAFGSDRTGIAAANLQQQENLANSNVIAGIANQGFNTALGAAQQQQQTGLAGAQQLANIGSTAYGEGANTASELGALGSGAQTAGLQGAAAQIQAGTVQQQTQQAQDTALYNQFLQQQSYPFQTSQFYTNAVEGLGANSGSTTTTTQPGGFFSDRRLKRDIKKIGETFDHQDVVTYKMGDDDRTRIGLIAQDVEKKHPEAVGVAGGFKVVDYGKATREAANQGHFYAGGVVPFRRARAVGGADDGLAGVLQTQQQMYSGMPGSGTSRQINQQGSGSHSLAVSNAPATAPQTGISQVNQGLGTVNNGYKLYNNIGRPGSGGVVPQSAPSTALQPAGLQASGVTTAGAPAETATEGALATAAPMDTAVDAGATAAGADAGAGAAAGAAGTAAAGAGTEAAADAAAALAAEYAAADVGALAILAAKRGGAIRKRYDVGGAPYVESGLDSEGNLNIPEDPNTNTLKAAPGAGKQPTGMQSMMKMADPSSWSGMMGSMFSNQALKIGGVAGRRGFDDGGDTGDMLPEVDVTANRDPPYDTVQVPDQTTSGVVAPNPIGAAPQVSDATPTGVAGSDSAPSSSGGLGAFFEKNKGYILPALKAISAMGTAKTVHPGVALAAGLGAGADSYTDTQQGLAKAADINAQAQGRQLENQMTGLKIKAAGDYFNSPSSSSDIAATVPSGSAPTVSPSSPQTSAPPVATSPSNAATAAAQSMDSKYRQQFYVPPILPAEADAMKRAAGAAIALGSDVPVQQIQRQIDQRKAAQTSQAQNVAQSQADQLYKQATNPTVDPNTRATAMANYNALHQWTGDTYDTVAGNVQNHRTSQPPIGVAAQRLTPEQRASIRANAYNEAVEPITVGNNLPTPRFKTIPGMTSPYDYVDAKTGIAIGPNEGASSQTATPTAATGTVSARPTGLPAVTPGTAPAARPAAAPGAPSAPAPTADPYLNKALADPTFRQKPLPPVVDQTSKQNALDLQAINNKKRTELLADSEQSTNVAATALQYTKAAQAIMQSKGAPVTGLFGAPAAAVSSVFGGVNSTNYQEVAKYLGNAAAQQANQNFPNATQKEVGIQFTELSPHTGMNADTINNLLSTNARIAQYSIGLADRAKTYTDAGDDPLNFYKWNNKYYPRDKLINATQTGTGKDGSKWYKVNGKWVQ